MVNFIDSLLVLVILDLVILHAEAFWKNLLWQALRAIVKYHNGILDDHLAFFVLEDALADRILFFLRKDLVVLVEHGAADRLAHTSPSIVFLN